MLDTVILEIPINPSSILNYERFRLSAKNIEKQKGFSKHINNPTKEEKENNYMPRLTIIRKAFKVYLKVEFSAPNIVFRNNLDELEEKDFELIVCNSRERIEKMGIKLWSHQIRNAKVTSFHPSKNIVLSKGYTASFSIRELSKINLHQKLDITKVKFRNNGEELHLYSNRHSLVLYDKINDLTKPPKRATDENQNKQQKLLFNHIKNKRKDLEVLRIEVRLSHGTKLKQVLAKIGFTGDILFKDIFKKEICKKIIQLYWDNFFEKDLFLFNVNNNPQNLLQTILMKYPKTKIKSAIMLVGLILLNKDKEGMRGFRSITKNYRPKTSWLMLNNYLRNLKGEAFAKPTHGFIKDIRKSIYEFKPFRIKGENPICYVKNCKV